MPLSTTPPSMSGEDHPADYDSLEQAARWYASLHVGQASDDERLAWQAWLDERPQNRRAWRHVETVSLRFAPLRADGERDAASVAISVSSSQAKKRRLVLRSMAALGGVGLAAWGLLRMPPVADAVLAWNADYRTRVGEVNDFLLPDGTHLWLNTNSAVDVAFGDECRLLTLRLGEVLIDTGKDAAGRPFFVETGASRMQALGTRFMVRQLGEETCLSVFAGRVEIQTASGQRAIVEAGQQRRFTAGSLSEADVANPARQAWTRGAIVAEDLPLGELVAELARYQRGYIHVSPAIAALRVSGRYPINDLPKAIGMLERDFPLQVSRPIPWWTSIGARTP